MKIWNWQQKDWPKFSFDKDLIQNYEKHFLKGCGEFLGIAKSITENDKKILKIEIVGSEAFKTSEIEGEILNHESLQSSIRRNFGLTTSNKATPKEDGIAEMFFDLYQNFDKDLTHKQLFLWHKMLFKENKQIKIGAYRTHKDAMQVVSGKIYDPKIHFEAPPAKMLKKEMGQFISWFNQSRKTTPTIIRAAITHLYFVSIHPFEDGNGRLARALTIKALSQSVGEAVLITLSNSIQEKKKAYYKALEDNNKSCKVDNWVNYFAKTLIDAQKNTQNLAEFLLKKKNFYEKFKNILNERQTKVVARIFKEGINGFDGGLSADNYLKITKTSRATATRDLQELVELNLFSKSGSGKWTRYFIKI